jgi:myosin heavy subunit
MKKLFIAAFIFVSTFTTNVFAEVQRLLIFNLLKQASCSVSYMAVLKLFSSACRYLEELSAIMPCLASLRIQRAWRLRQKKSEDARKRMQERDMANKIQNKTKTLVEKKRLLIRAAICIQRFTRGFIVRNGFFRTLGQKHLSTQGIIADRSSKYLQALENSFKTAI